MADRVKNKDLLKRYLPLKRYSNDLPFDLTYIVEDRFSRFKGYLDDLEIELFKGVIRELKCMASQVDSQSEKIRLYIFSDIKDGIFVNLDFAESEVKRITDKIDDIMIGYPKKFRARPEYISTIYIFQGEKLTYYRDLYLFETTEIIRHYRSSDLLIHKTFLRDTSDDVSHQ